MDARIIACTNRDLEDMIGRGEFREELYYRVNVVNIRLPALRDRPEDLPLLAEHFVTRFREKRGKGILGLSPETLEVLRRYDFPGDVARAGERDRARLRHVPRRHHRACAPAREAL